MSTSTQKTSPTVLLTVSRTSFSASEGDMIRPLGLVTLYFGYAEYELDYARNRATDRQILAGCPTRPSAKQRSPINARFHASA